MNMNVFKEVRNSGVTCLSFSMSMKAYKLPPRFVECARMSSCLES